MRSLVEIFNDTSLNEGVFDLGKDKEKKLDKEYSDMFLKTCKGNFKSSFFKDGTLKIVGKMIISGVISKGLSIRIREFQGNLIIENCPNLESLSFIKDIAVFKGSLTINQCPSLKSLKGIPGYITGDLSVTNCKSLKSYEGIDYVNGDLYWSGNGKKYTKDQLVYNVKVVKNIFCSGDETDANVSESIIYESLNNQWLQRLSAQLRKYPYQEYVWRDDKYENRYNKLIDIFCKYGKNSSGVGRVLDKITNEDIDVYDLSNEDDRKEVGKALYNTYSGNDEDSGDVFLIYNKEIGEFEGGLGYLVKPRGGNSRVIQYFSIPNKNVGGKEIRAGRTFGKQEARSWLTDKLGSNYSVIVIKTGDSTGTSRYDLYTIRTDRFKQQKGIIKPGDIEQYEKIAAENLKRYKEIIAQNKLNNAKNSNEYNDIIDRYEKIQLRIIKLIRAIAKDPQAYDSYKVNNFFEWCKDEQRYNYNRRSNGSGPVYFGENGLMYYFKNFMDNYLTCYGKNVSYSSKEHNLEQLKISSNRINKAMDAADTKLKQFGV